VARVLSGEFSAAQRRFALFNLGFGQPREPVLINGLLAAHKGPPIT